MFEKNGSCLNQKLPMIDFVTPSSGIFLTRIFKSQKLKADKLCGQQDKIMGTHIEKRPQPSL